MERQVKIETDDYERLPVTFGNKTFILKIGKLTEELDIEELLKIHFDNIIGELITFPLIKNKMALLKDDAYEEFRALEFDLKVFYNQKYYQFQKEFQAKQEKFTEKSLESAIYRDSEYIAKNKHLFKMEKMYNHLSSICWDMKDKSEKLNVLSQKIIPSEFENEILEGSINGVFIKVAKNTF